VAAGDVNSNAESQAVYQAQPSEEDPAMEEVVSEVPASDIMEAKTQDPREPPVADLTQYDRSWSTEFEAECPEGFTRVSQEVGCPAVFKTTKRSSGNGLVHLQFEQCQLPMGHRDRVKVKYRGRSMKQAGMTVVHHERSMKSVFRVVDLQAYTSWIRRREGLFEPSFCQGCCRKMWAIDVKAPVDQAV
jgi:hypothetical protein